MKKVTIIGNSIALRVRPPESETRGDNKVYGTLLESKLRETGDWTVLNFGLGRRLAKEFAIDKDQLIRTFPDYFVINLGCVDAPTREVPLWCSDVMYGRRQYPPFGPLITLYYRVISKYFRTSMVRLRGRKPWISKLNFSESIDLMLETLIKETSAQIIVLGINPGSERIEQILPGTLKNYREYNEILKRSCERDLVHFIDVSDLSAEEHFPDGIHYSSKGHEVIADRIFELIVNLERIIKAE